MEIFLTLIRSIQQKVNKEIWIKGNGLERCPCPKLDMCHEKTSTFKTIIQSSIPIPGVSMSLSE
jgi:hypothetical protein